MRTPLILATLTGCTILDTPTRVVTDVELEWPTEGLARASVEQGRGDALLSGEPTETAVLRVRLRGPDNDRRDADVLDRLHVVLEQQDDTLVAEAWIDDDALDGYGLETELVFPAGMDLTVVDGSGDLDVLGAGALIVSDGSGDLTIAGATEVQVVDGSGDADITDVAGDLVVEDGSGDLFVSDIGGDATLFDGSGDVYVERVGGLVTVTDGSGDIVIGPGAEVVIEESGSGSVR